MAETTKKFLDLTGLQKYDELLKAKVAADIKVVQDDLNTRKVKDTADSTTITWSKAENGTYTASVAGNVVVDAEYQTVKTKATQSAAAWTKFLEGTTGLYPNNVTPGLKDLATTASVTKAVSDGDATTLASAKSYADGLASNYDAAGAAAQALVDAKAYADSLADNYDAAGAAEAAKAEAISEANSHTNTEIGKVNDKIAAINTSIAGGVHFRGVVAELPASPFTGYVNGDIIILGNKEYILNKPTDSEGAWVELGDTTAESQRITALEDDVEILRGVDTVEGSVAKALKDAKAFTTSEINTLVGSTGQVGKNTAAITKLNGGKDVVDSVDYKIAQAVSNIEASIDTITEAEINALFA